MENEEERSLTLSEKIDQLSEVIKEDNKKNPRKKKKKFRLPMKGKVSKSRLKKGYATVMVIHENDGVAFTREKIEDSTIKMGDTYHDVESTDCLSYKGKPFLIIPKKSSLPYNPNIVKNTTFSQKHIMSRMMNETLNNAKRMGGLGISIGAAILIGVVAYAFIAG